LEKEMRKVFALALVTAALALSATAFARFGSAGPSSKPTPPPKEVVDSLLNEMAPGAKVTTQPDGSVAVTGQVSVAVQAELQQATKLAAIYPASVRCTGSAVTASCAAVPDAELLPALRAGELVYARALRRGVGRDVTDHATPLLTRDELQCSAPNANGVLACSHVDHMKPVIAANQTVMVTYQPYHVTIDASGRPTSARTGKPFDRSHTKRLVAARHSPSWRPRTRPPRSAPATGTSSGRGRFDLDLPSVASANEG
jgi:hypothetical protein